MDCIDLFKRAAMALQTDPRYLALDQAHIVKFYLAFFWRDI